MSQNVLTRTAGHASATVRPVSVVVALRVDAGGAPQFGVLRGGRLRGRAGIERGALVREGEDAPGPDGRGHIWQKEGIQFQVESGSKFEETRSFC